MALLPTWATLFLSGFVIGGVATLSVYRRFVSDDVDPALLEDVDVDRPGDDEAGRIATVKAPDVKSRGLRALVETYRMYRHIEKRKRLAKKGYIQWYIVDGAWPTTPAFVKPKRKGGGVPELKRDGQRYLFPEGAAVPDRSTGIRTVVHKQGEMDPVNVNDPVETALPADAAQEWLDLRVSDSAPSLLDTLGIGGMGGLSAGEMVRYAIIGTIVFAVVQQVLL